MTPEKIKEALREVLDPEIGINVVDLGLIKELVIGDERIDIKMVLTAPGCPLSGYLKDQVKKKIEAIAEGKEVNVILSDEPWTPPQNLRNW
ncbi:MAG: metal-sulfur cluster assembly factor [candidate division KSB1 bacterium]|nr:metal-sulfur cluster assembly factor [candidate division KSB1 bacterium]